MSLIPAFHLGIWNGWLFMSSFILQYLVMVFSSKEVLRKSHVPATARGQGSGKHAVLIANAVWFLALIYSVFLPFARNPIWLYLGLGVFVIGLIFLITATITFITTPVDQPINSGPYQFSRHPMYLATFLICLATGIAAASWLFLLLTGVMAILFRQEALIEEKYCSDKYGIDYQNYLKKAPRWFGKPGGGKSG